MKSMNKMKHAILLYSCMKRNMLYSSRNTACFRGGGGFGAPNPPPPPGNKAVAFPQSNNCRPFAIQFFKQKPTSHGDLRVILPPREFHAFRYTVTPGTPADCFFSLGGRIWHGINEFL